MKFYKTNTGVYISTPLEYSQYEQITEEEYYENVPPIPEDDELSAQEALDIIVGGGEA